MRLNDISIKKKLVAIFLLGMLVVVAFMLLNIRELRLIGGEADILSRPRQDTMLLAAEVAHLQWASRVQSYLLDNGETTLEASLDGHTCAFGHWFYGPGKAGLERELPALEPLFQKLGAVHLALHDSAVRLKAAMERGDSAQARRLFEDVTMPLLKQVQEILTEARGEINTSFAGTVEKLRAKIHMTTMLDMGLGTLTVLGCCLALWLLIRGISAPLARLKDHAGRVAQGEFSNVPIRQADEVGQLAADFNRMAGQLEQNVNRIQESMALQERFMADFSHEMKTPMTSIIGYADLLRSQVLTPDEQMDAANYIFSEGKRLEALGLKLLDMLSLDRSKLQLVPASPADLVAGLLEHLKRVYAQKGIALQYRTAEGMCFLEPDLFKTLLVNLMDNARKALDNGGYIYVWQEMLPDGCRVRVLDNGRGIPPEALTHLTEAFYRVDKSRSRAQGGAGLGLSLCNEIVQLHGGTMQFESRVGNGTVVTVELKGGRV